MRNILAAILLIVVLGTTAQAQSQLQRVNLQNGDLTNSIVTYGTNKLAALNRIAANGSFDLGLGTNTAVVVRGPRVGVTAQTVGVGIGGQLTSAGTSAVDYTFQRSFDGTNWYAWTNLTVVPAGTTRVFTNAIFTLGDWHYIRTSHITNANGAFWTSNFLEFYWKQ